MPTPPYELIWPGGLVDEEDVPEASDLVALDERVVGLGGYAVAGFDADATRMDGIDDRIDDVEAAANTAIAAVATDHAVRIARCTPAPNLVGDTGPVPFTINLQWSTPSYSIVGNRLQVPRAGVYKARCRIYLRPISTSDPGLIRVSLMSGDSGVPGVFSAVKYGTSDNSRAFVDGEALFAMSGDLTTNRLWLRNNSGYSVNIDDMAGLHGAYNSFTVEYLGPFP